MVLDEIYTFGMQVVLDELVLYFTMCTSSVPREGVSHILQGCESIIGRRKCGTGLATAPLLATFWGGEPALQGIMILGTPLGHEDFVRVQLEHIVDEHNVLLERIPSLPDVQSAWALFALCQCSSELCSSRDSARSWPCISHKFMTPVCGGVCAPS